MPDPTAVFQIAGRDISLGAFDSARRSLNRLTNSAKRAVTAFTPLASVVSATGFAAAAREAVQMGRRIEVMSRTAGVGAELLQSLEVEAERLGLQGQSAGTALQRFSRRIGEVGKNTGVLKKVFEDYNIELKDSSGNLKSTETLLREYADVVKTAGNSQEQLRLAVQAFDIEGGRFVNFLRQGSAGIDELISKSKEAGLVLEADTVKSLARAATAIDEFKRKITIAVGNIVVDFQSERGLQILSLQFLKVASQFAGAIAEKLAATVFFVKDLFVGVADVFGDRINLIINKAIEKFNVINPFEDLKPLDVSGTTFESAFKKAAENFSLDVETRFEKTAQILQETIDELRALPPELAPTIEGFETNIPDAVEESTKAVDTFKNRTGSAIGSFVKDLAKGEGAFKRFTSRLLDDMLDLLINSEKIFGKGGLPGLILGGLGGLFKKKPAIGGLGAGGAGLKVATGLLGFQNGGSFTVGGSGGADSQVVAFRATPGEPVAVGRNHINQAGGPQVIVNQTIHVGEGVNAAAHAAVLRMLGPIQNAAIAGVLEAKQRGGGLGARL